MHSESKQYAAICYKIFELTYIVTSFVTSWYIVSTVLSAGTRDIVFNKTTYLSIFFSSRKEITPIF